MRRTTNTSRPKHFRINVLETSKEIIENLKTYRELIDTRDKKNELLRFLRGELKELEFLLNKLREGFPTAMVSEYEKAHPKKIKPEEPQAPAKVSRKRSSAPKDLAELEGKIKNIEDKLKSLS